MSNPAGPVCEITLDADAGTAGELDDWLTSQIADLHRLAPIDEARVVTPEPAPDDAERRVILIGFDSESDLSRFLETGPSPLAAAAMERFGDRVTVEQRVLHARGAAVDPRPRCLNCGAALSGQYCGQCGQRSQSRLISLWELVRDAFGDLTELDSRVWRTLLPLAFHPGRLTADYLQGRRARYLPPFRTYLVLSLLFFLIAFFDPRQQLGLLYPEESATMTTPVTIGTSPDDAASETPGPGVDDYVSDGEPGCELDVDDFADTPPWLKQRLTQERLDRLCERITADGSRHFSAGVLDNIPVALYVLLPLMALVFKILYPLSRRFYVEHLLFVVYFHAFFFLALIMHLLVSKTASAFSGGFATAALFIIPLYIPVYLYKAMRRVYQQGHWLTAFKFVTVSFAYLFSFALMLAGAAIVAVLSL